MRLYPDSVSLVRPPKTTMPKTLAALPRSQYATIFSLTSGKCLFRSLAALILWLKEDRGDDRADLESSEAAAVAYHLDVKVASVDFGRTGARKHRQRQNVNTRCGNFGAGLAEAGHVRATVAMFAVMAEPFLKLTTMLGYKVRNPYLSSADANRTLFRWVNRNPFFYHR